MKFSELAFEFTGNANPLYTLREELLAKGKSIVDLISANPAIHGTLFPQDLLRDALSHACSPAAVYKPDSFGQRLAREAISGYYSDKCKVSAEQIVVTPGTSLSYFYCFQLLAGPGDEILCPQPSYPLLDYIARLCHVRLSKYDLLESRNWAIDLDRLSAQINSKTRAIVLISPHNPTGMVASSAEIEAIANLARRHELAIIADEVFAEFLFELDQLPRAANSQAPLVFTLNGFSKAFALPGIKFGWMLVTGDEQLCKRSMSALEMISDTFLPVNEITQFAAPEIFRSAPAFLKEYRDWVANCRNAALAALRGLEFVHPQGGFYLTIPLKRNEEDVALDLLKEELILVHPGHYYDVPGDHIVCTFLHRQKELPAIFEQINKLCS